MKGVINTKIMLTNSLLLTVILVSFPAQAQYGGGTGEANAPYLIYTAEQLKAIGLNEDDWDKHFNLMADIDLSIFDGEGGRPEFNVIGTHWNTKFTGVFDGNGHTISNLTIRGENYLGLFGQVGPGAEVRNLGVLDVDIRGSKSFVGGLVGYCYGGHLSNCYSTGLVIGDMNVGGLLGYIGYGAVLIECYSTSVVNGEEYVGGLVGDSYGGRLRQCYSTGTVSGTNSVGGLVGANFGGLVTTCYSTSNVSGNSSVGGLMGNNGGAVTSCYSIGTSSGENRIGGLIGIGNPDRVKNSFWDIETSGLTVSAGGFGLTTSEMMDPEILGLNGFGRNPNWILDSGRDYPRLSWEGTAGQIIPEPVVDWLDGIGTLEEPYQIEQADQLLLLHKSSILWDKHFILNADIDMDPNLPGRSVFEKAVIPEFEGSFVGKGHIILNLQIKGGDNLGVFGKLAKGSIIRDVGLVNILIQGNGSNVGGIVGRNSGGHVLNCHNAGKVTGNRNVGGLVGYNDKGDVIHCYSSATVTGNRNVGGLVGYNYKGDVIHCYSSAIVNGNRYVGGLVGNNYKGDVSVCYSTGAVPGTSSVGGLVGNGDSNRVTYCFWDTQTSGQTMSCGGRGLTTAEMQKAATFLDAGWDFIGETENGIEDIWWILEGQDYPKLVFKLSAFSPYPQNDGVSIFQPVILSWAPGASALHHEIYLGEDKETVADATVFSLGIYRGRQTAELNSYDPGILEWGKTYYWRIDEVNNTNPDSLWTGPVWSFTTTDFIVVDDFESYNDLNVDEPMSNRIYLTWVDGYDNPWANGAVVGDLPWGPEQTIAHSGNQSMPFNYDNAVGKSEATANIDNLEIGRDWTIVGARILSLWFRGGSANALETMYVVLNDIAGVYNDDPNATQADKWTEWRIDLQEFADQGVDLTNVSSITIGLGNRSNPVAGGRGKMWFDDIRLYRPPEPEPEL